MELRVFDLDHTLVKGNSSFHFCRYLIAHRVLPLTALLYSSFCYVRHQFLGMTLQQLHQNIFHKILFKFPWKLLEEHADLFVQRYLSSALYLPAAFKLREAQHLGHYTLLLSNAPSFLVSRIARAFGMSEWRATEYRVDENERFVDIASIMEGESKARCMLEVAGRLGIATEKITAYSDSILDLPLLLAAGTGVPVNPDHKLRIFSKTRGWNILS